MKHFDFKCLSNHGVRNFWKQNTSVVKAFGCSIIIAGATLMSAETFANRLSIAYSTQSKELTSILKNIEKKSGYVFFYKTADVKDVKVSKDVDLNKPLSETLDKLFKLTSFHYTIKGKTIAINKIADEITKSLVPVTGRVVNENGHPILGATIAVKGTSKVTSSGEDGSFSIDVAENEIVVISSIGYEQIEIAGSDVSQLQKIVLNQQTNQLEELVVIGYGAVKRKNVSGSVATVKASDMTLSTSSNFGQALQGKAAGVQVLQSTGQPGGFAEIKIRSNPSNANAGVLYVVDGVPINNRSVNGGSNIPGAPVSTQSNTDVSPLNFLNPNDIESIDFLKDAASAAIYGARAGAGVVLITTKRGKTGAPQISYSGSYGSQRASKMYQVLDTRTYMEQVNLIDRERWMQTNGIAPYYGNVNEATLTPFVSRFTQEQIDNTKIFQNAMDAITRTGYTQQHNLSMSGGSEKTKYLVSGNYFDQKGVILASGLKRYNFRVNLDQQISEKIKAGISATMSNSKINATGTGGRFETGGVLASAMYYPANMPLKNEDGTFPLNPRYTNIPNPLSYETVTNDINSFRLLTNAYLSWEIVNGLTAKGMYSYDQGNNKRNVYLPRTYSAGAQTGGLASVGSIASTIKLLEYTLDYKKSFGDHQINGLLGYSYNQFQTESLSGGNQNFTTDAWTYNQLGSGQSPRPNVGSGQTLKTIASYFARAIYTYQDKYTLQASLRRDGATNFAENKKWGYFPGIAGNWIISEEEFLQSSSVINFLKLRTSFGTTGNSDFEGAAQEAIFSNYSGGNYGYVFGNGNIATGLGPNRIANPNLSWETAKEFNIGLDFGLFNDGFSGSFDYFTKTIHGLITNVAQPAQSTLPVMTINAGKTRSTGFEIGLNSKNFVSKDANGFSWTTSLNFSHYLSYWVERAPQNLATLSRFIAPSGRDALFNGVWGYLSQGIYNGIDSRPAHMPNILAGSIIIKDVAGYDTNGQLIPPDGVITAADQVLLGNLDPKFNYGIGNTFSYRNFDLNVFLAGAKLKAWSPYGPNRDLRVASLSANMGDYGWNTMPISLERWTYLNPEATFPTGLSDATHASQQNNSDYWLEDADFLRCRNITLGYSFPSKWLEKQKVVKNIRMSFDVQNPFTITNYSGLDPELNQNNYYPLTKSYVFGLNIGF